MNEDIEFPLSGDMIANFDQATAHMVNIAVVVGVYYTNLIENDVPPDLAAVLCRDWHARLIGSPQGGDQDE